MRNGVMRVFERKLYPGYVFVEMACQEDGSVVENVWFMVKETTGVGDFIGSDGKPTSMSTTEVVQMLAAVQKAEDQPTLSGLNFKKGDQVKINEGPFENYEGEVDSVDEKRGMVSVIVTIFGRSTPVEVEYGGGHLDWPKRRSANNLRCSPVAENHPGAPRVQRSPARAIREFIPDPCITKTPPGSPAAAISGIYRVPKATTIKISKAIKRISYSGPRPPLPRRYAP
jgi:transcriptional antiterminator NusG